LARSWPPRTDDTIPNPTASYTGLEAHDHRSDSQDHTRDSDGFGASDRPAGFRAHVIDDVSLGSGHLRSKSLDPPWTSTAPTPRRRLNEALVFGVGAVALAAVGGMLFWVLSSDPTPDPADTTGDEGTVATAPQIAATGEAAAMEDPPNVVPLPPAVTKMRPRARSARAAALRERARDAQEQNEDAEAERLYSESLEFEPNSGEAMAGLADVIAQQSRMEEALRWARRAAETAPFEPAHHEKLGDLLMEANHLQEAIVAYENALALAPRRPRIPENLAKARRMLRNQTP